MRTLIMLAIGAMAAVAPAQLTNVVPTSANGVAGGLGNLFPWGSTASLWPGLRVMCIYDSSHFTAAPIPITGPIMITNVKWRANDTSASWTGGTYSNATLGLGTAAVDYTQASTTWTANTGQDYTTVYNGPVTVQPGTGAGGGVPGPFIVDIQVNPPFLYDPAQGDLVVDTNFLTGAWTGGSQVAMDVMTTGSAANRIVSTAAYPNANFIDAAAPVIEITYSPPGGGTVATVTQLGTGCASAHTSFYEYFFSPTAFDLSNSAITMLPSGSGGYLVVPGISPYIAPSATATTLTLGDDAETTVPLAASFPHSAGSTNSLVVCSNGFVSIAPGNGTNWVPAASAMLGANQTAWWAWQDLDPTIPGGGSVKFEQIGNIACITFDGVYDWGGTSAANANTFQFQFDTASGAVHIVFQTMSTLGNGLLVGYSPSGPNSDPGNRDISATLPATFTLGATDLLPLTMTSSSRPLIGTTWNLDVQNVPAAGIGVDIFGLSDPAISDLGFLGAPGCGLRSSLDLLLAWPVTGNTHTYSLPIPNLPVLVNLHVYTTSAVFGVPPVNAFGAIISNGIDGRIGDI